MQQVPWSTHWSFSPVPFYPLAYKGTGTSLYRHLGLSSLPLRSSVTLQFSVYIVLRSFSSQQVVSHCNPPTMLLALSRKVHLVSSFLLMPEGSVYYFLHIPPALQMPGTGMCVPISVYCWACLLLHGTVDSRKAEIVAYLHPQSLPWYCFMHGCGRNERTKDRASVAER